MRRRHCPLPRFSTLDGHARLPRSMATRLEGSFQGELLCVLLNEDARFSLTSEVEQQEKKE